MNSSSLMAIAEQALVTQFEKRNTIVSHESKPKMFFILFFGLMLFTGTGFIIYASYVWLTKNYALEIAAALTGGIALSLALLSCLIAYAVTLYKRHKIKEVKNQILDIVQSAFEIAEEEFSEPIRENPKTSALAASVAGYLIGERLL